MYRVLLLCKDNSVLSPMAEGYFKMNTGDMVEVYSAGIYPKRVSSQIVKIVNEDGIDLSGHKSRALQDYRHINFDYILTFDNESEIESQHLPSRPVKYHFEFDKFLPDYKTDMESDEVYRNLREKMKKTVKSFIKEHLVNEGAV